MPKHTGICQDIPGMLRYARTLITTATNGTVQKTLKRLPWWGSSKNKRTRSVKLCGYVWMHKPCFTPATLHAGSVLTLSTRFRCFRFPNYQWRNFRDFAIYFISMIWGLRSPFCGTVENQRIKTTRSICIELYIKYFDRSQKCISAKCWTKHTEKRANSHDTTKLIYVEVDLKSETVTQCCWLYLWLKLPSSCFLLASQSEIKRK